MRRSRSVLVLLAYLALRLWLATTPGYGPDIGQFKLWSLLAVRDGVGHLYASEGPAHTFAGYDYPPFYAYVLWVIGKLYTCFEPDALAQVADRRVFTTLELETLARTVDRTLFTVLIKLPIVLGDLAIAWLLVRIVRGRARGLAGAREGGLEGGQLEDGSAASRSAATVAGGWLALAWLFNPAVLLDGGDWGQPDCVHSAFALAAFAVLGGAIGPAAGGTGDRPRACVLAGILFAVSARMKPLAAPLLPLLLAASLVRCGWRATLLGGAAAITTGLLLFAPFLAASGVAVVAKRILFDVGIMSFTSVNAHNVWWLAGPWSDSEQPWLGPLTPRWIGLLLVGGFLAALLALGWRRHRARRAGLDAAQLLALAGGVVFGFFMLSTHMHENHAYAAIPLLMGALAAAPTGGPARRALVRCLALVTIGVVLNLVPHDFTWRDHWPFTLGAQTPYRADDLVHVLPLGEYVAGWFGTLWNLATCAVLFAWLFGAGLVRLPWRTELPAPAAE